MIRSSTDPRTGAARSWFSDRSGPSQAVPPAPTISTGPDYEERAARLGDRAGTLACGIGATGILETMARPADALPDPVLVLIDDESSALSDEQIANETAELLASLASGPVIDLDIAELIRQDRADRGA